jgi:hypothetical protein
LVKNGRVGRVERLETLLLNTSLQELLVALNFGRTSLNLLEWRGTAITTLRRWRSVLLLALRRLSWCALYVKSAMFHTLKYDQRFACSALEKTVKVGNDDQEYEHKGNMEVAGRMVVDIAEVVVHRD